MTALAETQPGSDPMASPLVPQPGETWLVFGGTFDPPHLAHLELAGLARETLGARGVIYIPAGQPPLKDAAGVTPARHRLAMLRLLLAAQSWAVIDACELERAAAGTPTYTVDTLKDLRRRLGPGVTLRLLIGGDQLRRLDRWKSPDEVVSLAEPVVMVRPPDTAASLLAGLPAEFDPTAWAPRLLDLPLRNNSATEIRARVAQGLPMDELTLPAVAGYIREQQLYRATTAR